MITMSSLPSTTSLLSAYSTAAMLAVLLRSIVGEIQSLASKLIPKSIQEMIILKLERLFGKISSEITLIIDEHSYGIPKNEVYEASKIYLEEKISPSNKILKVTKAQGDKDLFVTVNEGEIIVDFYQDVTLKWVMKCTKISENQRPPNSEKVEQYSFRLSFLKEHKALVLGSYLPYIMEFAKTKKENNRVVKLRSLGGGGHRGPSLAGKGSINLIHPSTFDTLAMDPKVKKAVIDDLDRFVRRREYYRRVGKAWKRGYLLYGPPGTGKSSLIAAMANHLKFNVYDLELKSVRDNASLRSLLVSTENRSIVVIEDIDCSLELQNRQNGSCNGGETGLTLSGLLNFVDGLWSSCGDEMIIVFTTNYKEKLDPALLRPGRMDMHIHLSFLTPSGFKVLALNYLGISSHPLFTQIENLMVEVEVTPAVVAEELLRNEDPDTALEELLQFLQDKKSELSKPKCQEEQKSAEPEEEIQETIEQGSEVEATN